MRPDTLQYAGRPIGIGGDQGCARTVPGAAAGTRSATVTSKPRRWSRKPTRPVQVSTPSPATTASPIAAPVIAPASTRPTRAPLTIPIQIGRASCRDREETLDVLVCLYKG